ncbi:S26 family signal peptidase [Arthrobacter sp. GMC3]|uniref:S26 family signal peptidase n=1 Tax=Arthrobacter sp. GMC3 TaxID=2058894 RepID=UPI000CE4EC69|nr:S26 family signal peptidase [Arthrobacter sp. GMC3]
MGFLREALLTIIATAGVLCLVALILGAFFKVSFVVFRTGSMEPNFPVGAISLVMQTPASDLVPGDVAAVLPENYAVMITHRVVAVSPVAGMPGVADLVLKGDANASQDPLPYRVASAKKVLATVPGVGAWIMAMRGPWFLGVGTVLLSALVMWAFWPKREPAHRKEP